MPVVLFFVETPFTVSLFGEHGEINPDRWPARRPGAPEVRNHSTASRERRMWHRQRCSRTRYWKRWNVQFWLCSGPRDPAAAGRGLMAMSNPAFGLQVGPRPRGRVGVVLMLVVDEEHSTI